MKQLASLAFLLALLACGGPGGSASDTAELTRLLQEFLAGASRNDAAVHDRFWAEDLIYTGSSGKRIGKADILKEVRAAGPGEPSTRYSAEEIRVHLYGDIAVVAFRLLGTTVEAGQTRVARYLNTGTFRKEAGGWRAVAWQATRMAPADEEAREGAGAATAAFYEALRGADRERLSGLLHPEFIWTRETGDPVSRERLLDDLESGRLKYARLETAHELVWVEGETAVVRGIALRQLAPAPGGGPPADREPVTLFFTLTLLYKDGDWKAVALHSSRT